MYVTVMVVTMYVTVICACDGDGGDNVCDGDMCM